MNTSASTTGSPVGSVAPGESAASAVGAAGAGETARAGTSGALAERPDVRTVAELRARGFSTSTISARCRAGGPWRRLLPGVVQLGARTPGRPELIRAALAFAGPGAVVTGADALAAHGVRVVPTGRVHVLVPAARRSTSRQFVLLERTTRLPDAVAVTGLPYAPLPRAALDLARGHHDRRLVGAILTAPLQHGACSLHELRDELDLGSQRGSSLPRAVLNELGSRVHSLTEHQARKVIATSPLPAPSWNVPLHDEHGTLLCVVDAWWEEVALALDVGANEYRLAGRGPAGRTGRRRTLLNHDVSVLHVEPRTLFGDPERVRRLLAEAYLRAAELARPKIRAVAGHTGHTGYRPAP